MRVVNFLKTKNIIKLSPDDTLSHGLSLLNSSHDAGFVFTENDEFRGVINPYYSAIKSSNPGNAKIEHCVFHPPRLQSNFPISRLAQLMIESKIHYLPVFDENDKFSGIVSARNLLKHLKDSPLFNLKIKDVLNNKKQPLVTLFETDLVSQALNTFKTSKVSKIVLIDKDMKLRGILTHYDLINFLITLKRKEHRGDRVGTRTNFSFQQVKNFSKSFVLTLSAEDNLQDALELILNKSIGSVVITDERKHPIGIITTRDFLRILTQDKPKRQIEIITKDLSAESRKILGSFFNQLTSAVKKIPDLAKARIFVKEEKKGGVFQAVLALIPRKGQPKVIKTQGKNLGKMLNKLGKKNKNR